MLRALLVDDEPPARRRLARLLTELASDPTLPPVAVVGEAGDGEAALAEIERAAPTLLFLDIQMPGLSGLALAERHQGLPPIVFTTAHDQHALAAFAVYAVDYLLKPIGRERLAQAVVRAAQRSLTQPPQLSAGQGGTAAAQSGRPRIAVIDRGAIRFFDALALTRFWSTDKYTAFLADGSEQLTQEALSELAERLAGHSFLRVHRGELVNLAKVRALHLGSGSCELELSDGQRARVSRRLLPELKAALGLRELG